MSKEDIEFLRAICGLIGAAVERVEMVTPELVGMRKYAMTLTSGELGAAHQALKQFVADREKEAGR